ncbi:hypothetical protein EC991_009706 [Linnemannia zychae]|nr:hypothetical protein EC991_009706 [Linnemannia zychae]
MMQATNSNREKPEWRTKCRDPAIWLITPESRPNFQIQMTESDYEKDAKREMWHMYELYDGDATVQHLEGIITKQDQCIIFLSIFQHLAQPFELQGSSQPGSRKILVSYLVNPEEDRITSTILLLPQLADWYPTVEILREVEPRLPQELVTMIVIDWTQTRGLCN